MTGSLMKAVRWLSPLLGHAGTGAPAATVIAPSAAPANWVRYAEQVTASITGWLEAEDAATADIRAQLLSGSTLEQGPEPLIMSLWIEQDRLSRVTFPSLGNAQADGDLQTFLIGRRFAAAAPTDMRQPLNIAIQLKPQVE